jgi:hypothetical protein
LQNSLLRERLAVAIRACGGFRKQDEIIMASLLNQVVKRSGRPEFMQLPAAQELFEERNQEPQRHGHLPALEAGQGHAVLVSKAV